MSDKPLENSGVPALSATNRKTAIETVLDHWFPLRSIYQSLQLLPKVLAGSNPQLASAFKDAAVPDYIQQVEAKRAELNNLPDARLLTLHNAALKAKQDQEARHAAERQSKLAQKAAAKEAERFYNRPDAIADLGYWAKMEYWTLEESIALLLGKNPKVVTWKAVQNEVAPNFTIAPPVPSAFLADYVRLWELAKRATAMLSAKLKPRDVVTWARSTDLVRIPPELEATFPIAVTMESADSRSLPHESEPVPATSTGTGTGTGKRWDALALRELQEYRDKHGTTAAAERFGITAGRIRQLLPKEPTSVKANDPFGRTAKRR